MNHIPVKVAAPTLDELIDSLLIEWHEFYRGYRYGTGAGYHSGGSHGYEAPTHHDWHNGAADARADRLRVEGIDKAMQAVPNHPEQHRLALEWQAKNLHSGSGALDAIALPVGELREILLIEARNMFITELRRRGLLG